MCFCPWGWILLVNLAHLTAPICADRCHRCRPWSSRVWESVDSPIVCGPAPICADRRHRRRLCPASTTTGAHPASRGEGTNPSHLWVHCCPIDPLLQGAPAPTAYTFWPGDALSCRPAEEKVGQGAPTQTLFCGTLPAPAVSPLMMVRMHTAVTPYHSLSYQCPLAKGPASAPAPPSCTIRSDGRTLWAAAPSCIIFAY